MRKSNVELKFEELLENIENLNLTDAEFLEICLLAKIVNSLKKVESAVGI